MIIYIVCLILGIVIGILIGRLLHRHKDGFYYTPQTNVNFSSLWNNKARERIMDLLNKYSQLDEGQKGCASDYVYTNYKPDIVNMNDGIILNIIGNYANPGSRWRSCVNPKFAIYK